MYRKPQIILNNHNNTKPAMKAVDLQTTRTSAGSTQRKGLVTTGSKVYTGSKKTVS